jgi:hypothetical protein
MIKIVKVKDTGADRCNACGDSQSTYDLVMQHGNNGHRLHLCTICLLLIEKEIGEKVEELNPTPDVLKKIQAQTADMQSEMMNRQQISPKRYG